uniref:CCAAT/enhancer-binding protein zeta (inferred by orthology to a human protein) n=1 Tax=Anisakis simplex TaxID=6269 RepID=A0A0M3J0E6_ANISI
LIKHSIEGKWYEYADADRSDANEADKEQLSKVEEKATYLLSRDIDVHNQCQFSYCLPLEIFLVSKQPLKEGEYFWFRMESKRNASEAGWLNTVIVQGTAGDRISAMQMFIQRSPVHALSHLNTLVSRVQKKNPREAFSILSVLKELFINEILPPTRKLIPLSKRPVGELEKQLEKGEKAAERRLIMWKFESDLKKLYENFVMALESLSNGMVVNVCAEACRAALDLLIERPEQEQRLLTLLVNKLGHPNRKFASRLVGYLMKLTQKQPNMRPIVVKEVERLIYRKNISCRAQLYAVTFLAQMQLNAGDVELAASLLTIYIGLFRILIAKQKIDDKIISALLTATNRAFPYAKNEAERLTKEIDTLYKVLHQSNFNTALQTLKLLHQLLVTSEGISDRFYSAFYRKLLDVEHSAKQQSQLFGLLYKTMKNDSETQRVIAFIKRMLQLSVNRSAAFAAATLVVISKLIEERPSLILVSKSANVS